MITKDESVTVGLQVGALFSCSRYRQGPNESGAVWDRMLDKCSSAEARQAGMAAATRALHHHIGEEVLPCCL